MRKLLFVLLGVIVFVACNTSTKTETTEQKSAAHACSSMSVDSFLVIADNYVGEELTVKGTVDHVCKHGGKRVRIFSSCPSKSIHGEAGETMGNFNAEIEGNSVCLTGIVAESKMDMAYVEEYEVKIKTAIEENKEEADMEHKEGVDHHAKLDQIAEWKAEIEASEKGYLSTYYLEVSKYELCDDDKESACCQKEVKKDSCCDKQKDSTDCEGEAKEEKPCSHSH